MNTKQFSFSSDTVFLQAHTVITNNTTFVIKQSLLHFCVPFYEDSSCTCFYELSFVYPSLFDLCTLFLIGAT
jgi:hypothetical protein